MSEPCPNAKKIRKMNMGKIVGYDHKCNPQCELCHGIAHVEDCPECDGCGLRKGGVRCNKCGCYGKIPAATVAA